MTDKETVMLVEQVRAIWRREIGRDDISLDDDFFALGGQSVIMARIQGAYIEELGVEVPVDKMFTHPTVASVCAYIESLEPAADDGPVRETPCTT